MSESPTPPLSFRRAAAADWPVISPWIAETWEDGDYIDEALWQEWIASPDGVTVAEADGSIAAIFRLCKLAEAEWWLEGVRVRPDLRGQGIGRVIMQQTVERFRREAHGMLRFFTSSQNEIMAKLAREAGFVHRMSYTQVEALPGAADYRNFKLLVPANLDFVWGHLRHWAMYRASHFVEQSWIAYFLTHARLGEYLNDPQRAHVVGWRQEGGLGGLAIIFLVPGSAALEVGYIAAPDDTTFVAMLEALRGLAAYRGQQKVEWKMPIGVGMERPLAATAYSRVWGDENLWLFELPLRS